MLSGILLEARGALGEMALQKYAVKLMWGLSGGGQSGIGES